jgi:hypothetical protein
MIQDRIGPNRAVIKIGKSSSASPASSTRRRRPEVLLQGRLHAPERRQAPLRHRADPGDGAGARAPRDDPVRRHALPGVPRATHALDVDKVDAAHRPAGVPRFGVCTDPARGGYPIELMVAPLNVGILYVFALAGQGIIGAAIAGWSSDNKFSLMGALRAASQMVSTRSRWGCRSSAR